MCMKRKYLFYLLLCILACTACHSSGKSGKEETLYSGEIWIAVDESFKPIMEEELQVYQALTPEAIIHPVYCSEVEAVSLLLKDSVRLAVTHRRLTEEELASFHARKFFPESVRLATSGVALITHRNNPDSVITVEQFRRIMTGRMTQWKELNPQSALGAIQVVFDNPNSGLLHYVMDSICQGTALSPSLKAQKPMRKSSTTWRRPLRPSESLEPTGLVTRQIPPGFPSIRKSGSWRFVRLRKPVLHTVSSRIRPTWHSRSIRLLPMCSSWSMTRRELFRPV